MIRLYNGLPFAYLKAGILFFLVTLLSFFSGIGQTIKILNLNTSNYPEVDASFIATTSEGVKIYNSSLSDFNISETQKVCKITELSNPTLDYQPISAVVAIDISLSMKGKSLALVKEGLLSFIDQLPLETSEVAITCFSDEAMIYTDFTQNRNRLVSAFNRIAPVNGTNFNNAFLDGIQGAFEVLKIARHKKVIIFVTDGLGVTDSEKVSELARNLDVTVFVLNVSLAAPADLKYVVSQTNGGYFERIKNLEQFNSAISSIFHSLKCTEFGTIKWLSTQNCDASKSLSLQYKQTKIEFDYNVPYDKVGKIEANPSLLSFGAIKPGLTNLQKLNIRSINIPIQLKNAKTSQSALFSFSGNSTFPHLLKPDEPFALDVNYSPKEAGISTGKMVLSFEECPDVNIDLIGGGREQLRLVFPKGGEVFPVGTDTTIRWEGVRKSQQVSVSYRLNRKQDWQQIQDTVGLKSLWKLPSDTSTKAQVRLSPILSEDQRMEISAVADAEKAPFIQLEYNKSGTMLLTLDSDGVITTRNIENGKIITSLMGFDAKKVMLTADDKSFVISSIYEYNYWDIASNKLVGRIPKNGKKVNTCYILADGTEMQIPGNLVMDPSKNVRLWNSLGGQKIFLINEPDLKWCSFTPNGQYAVTLDSKGNIKIYTTDSGKLLNSLFFKEEITSVLVSPNNQTALVGFKDSNTMINLVKGEILFTIKELRYRSFTPDGNYVAFMKVNNNEAQEYNERLNGKWTVRQKTDNSTTFFDSYSGKRIVFLPVPKYHLCSPQSNFVIFTQNDSLLLFNLKLQKFILKSPNKSILQASFRIDETKVMVLTSRNTLETYDTNTGALLAALDDFSGKLNLLAYHPTIQQFATISNNTHMEVWSPAIKPVQEEVLSGYFSLVSPKPVVKDSILFGDELLESIKELTISGFISNPTPYPIQIRKFEIRHNDQTSFEAASKDFPRWISPKSKGDEEFRFSPKTAGSKNSALYTYTSTDTFKTILTGIGIPRRINASTSYLDFGKVTVSQYRDTLAAVLVNTSNESLHILKLLNAGPDTSQFLTTIIPEQTDVPAGDTLFVPVKFAPTSRGRTSTTLFINNSLTNEPFRIIVRGEGVAPKETWIKGRTLNSADSLPISATVNWIDLEANKIFKTFETDASGVFLGKLNADRNFGIMALKENFISTSLNIDLSQPILQDTIYRDIFLTEIKPGATIRLNCIFFEFDKSELLASSFSDLQRITEALIKYPNYRYEIHGHTDADGSDTYNLALSKARATSVLNYLVKNGIAKEQLTIKYFGESTPVSTNETEEGKALNRRVELKVTQ